jgi:hypothetical protein
MKRKEEARREILVKSHQPKQDLTQFNTPYAMCSDACTRIHCLFIECFIDAFLLSIEKKTPGKKQSDDDDQSIRKAHDGSCFAY